MIFTIAGTQNVGKTTFLKDFLKSFSGWGTPNTDYRDLIKKEGLKINREGNLYSQQFLFDFVMKDLLLYSGSEKKIILDRSILDAYVYTSWLYENKPQESGVTEESVLKQYDAINNNLKRFDRIFYIPLNKCSGINVVEDKFRDTNLKYRKEIDDIFKKTIKSLNLNNVFEIYGEREERISMIRNARIRL